VTAYRISAIDCRKLHLKEFNLEMDRPWLDQDGLNSLPRGQDSQRDPGQTVHGET
jgi:hypothetical protein